MANHPLWRELSAVIIRYGGNLARLVKDICERAFRHPVSPWPLTLAPVLPSPAPSGTTHPDPDAQTAAASPTGPVTTSPAVPLSPATTAPIGRTAPPPR